MPNGTSSFQTDWMKHASVSASPILNPSHDPTKSEILWLLNMVMKHESFRTSDSLPRLFKTMFPDSVIADKFTMGRDKAVYSIKFGLAPVFTSRWWMMC